MDTPNNEDRCWICLCTPGHPADTDWRRPCNCRLFAHEKCLLSWTSQVLRHGHAPQCPLCHHPIRMARVSVPALVWRSKAEGAITRLVCHALVVKTVSGVLHSAGSGLFFLGFAILDVVCGTPRAEYLAGICWLEARVRHEPRVRVIVPSTRSYLLICAIPLLLGSFTCRVSVFRVAMAALFPVVLGWKGADTDTDTDPWEPETSTDTRIAALLPAANMAYCVFHRAIVEPIIIHFNKQVDALDVEPYDLGMSLALFPFWFTPSAELRRSLLQHVVPRVRRLAYTFAWPFFSRTLGDVFSLVPGLCSLVPRSMFRRNLLAGAVIMIARDIINVVTAYLRLRQARSARILDVHEQPPAT